MHVLQGDNAGAFYTVVIHTPTPAGTNLVGVTWVASGLGAGVLGSTTLTVGTGPGQITQAEHDSIVAGNTIEIISQINPNSSGTSSNSLNAMVNGIVSDWMANTTRKLQYYGFVLS